MPQLLCLRHIAESTRTNRVTVARVAEAVQLSMPTVSRIVDRLEAAELIVRERSTDDRRKVFLKVTPAGRRRVKKLPTPLHDQLWARLSSTSAEKQQALLHALEEIVEMMGAEQLDAAPMLMPGTDVKPKEEDTAP